jgi:hypothetical protein
MAFSQSGIGNVLLRAEGSDIVVSWTSTNPPGTTYQVYVDRALAWYGTTTRCHVPLPANAGGRNVWVEVGSVGAFEPTTDYSSSLAAPGGRSERAVLSWSGGTYLDPSGRDDVHSFGIYQSSAPGQPVSFAQVVDTVFAYPGGWINDGFGKGGFGGGGFGRAATAYTWESGPLGSGVWQFAVVPFDQAGNSKSAGPTVNVTIQAAPLPPAPAADGTRLSRSYAGPGTGQLTLNWLPSPTE